MKLEAVDVEQRRFPISFMCHLLGVSTSGFYAWKKRPESARDREDRVLAVEVRASFKRSNRRYGSPRIMRDLHEAGRRIGIRRTARIMRKEGLVARAKRRRVQTTNSKHGGRIAPNLLDRNFSVERPNTVWSGDITYIETLGGWMYLAVVIDLHSRMVVGWALANHMRDELVLDALDCAVRHRRPGRGILIHSDRGSQYASDDYLATLSRRGFTPSMSRRANCWDNSVVESFFSTLKIELMNELPFDSQFEARSEIAEYIEGFYNCQRRHSTLDYLSPLDYEKITSGATLAA